MKRLTRNSYKVVREKCNGNLREVEFWGFRTDPDKRDARKIAWDFLQLNARLLKLQGSLDTLDRHPKVIRSLGAWHVLYPQKCGELRIHRAYVTVHLDNEGRVYLAKNRAMPKAMIPKDVSFPVKERAARACALKKLRRVAEHLVFPVGEDRLPKMEKLLFRRKARLYPAYRFRLYLKEPRAEWIVYVNGRRRGVMNTYDNLALALARGRVFDPNPLAELGDQKLLHPPNRKKPTPLPAEAYRTVTLSGLKKKALLDGRYVTTDKTKWRANCPKGEFWYESGQRRFAEVMAYYHIDSAARYLETLGFRGACRIFGGALVVDAYGKRLGGSLAVDAHGSRSDNAWYSPGLGLLTFGDGGVNDAEDGEMILHEFGHALQDAICPDFGQSREAAAMGEGFGDYLAASFFAHKKVAEYRTSLMCWDARASHEYNPPCVRRVDEDRSFDDFVDEKGYEHENGKIWSATLWDIWEALGREKADTLIIESHFQLDAFTTFDRGARAIIDADQNLYGGRHRPRLLRIFGDRRIGPVA